MGSRGSCAVGRTASSRMPERKTIILLAGVERPIRRTNPLHCDRILLEIVAIRVTELVGRDEDEVNQPPDAAAAKRDELQDARPDEPHVEPVDPECPHENGEEQRDDELPLLRAFRRARSWLFRRHLPFFPFPLFKHYGNHHGNFLAPIPFNSLPPSPILCMPSSTFRRTLRLGRFPLAGSLTQEIMPSSR